MNLKRNDFLGINQYMTKINQHLLFMMLKQNIFLKLIIIIMKLGNCVGLKIKILIKVTVKEP